MRNLIIKTIFITLVAVFESTVSLPVLVFALFLLWMKKELKLFLIWLFLVSLIISVTWGIAWWISCLVLLFVKVSFDYFSQSISNKLLKLIAVITPAVLLFALILEIAFYWRIALYMCLSILVIFIFQKFLMVNYENKYL